MVRHLRRDDANVLQKFRYEKIMLSEKVDMLDEYKYENIVNNISLQ